ncbi:MAG TPA: hypothetical protein VJ746_18775 [Nitrospira sp.]|nr:hypothetical protein [Nitrospira sp.]
MLPIVAVLMLAHSACTLTQAQSKRVRHQAIENPCGHLADLVSSAESPPSPQSRTSVGARHETSSSLSLRTQALAKTLNVEHLAADIAVLHDERDLDAASQLQRLQVRQEFTERLSLLGLEVAAVVGQMDCEKVRADYVADVLSEIQGDRRQIGLMFAIVGDALIGVLGGALALAQETVLADAIDILGGSLAVIAGGGAEFITLKHEFRHPNNMLAEFVQGPETPSLFPSAIWRYLTAVHPNGEEGPSIRERILARWRQQELLPNPASSSEDREEQQTRAGLIMGEGGSYNIDDLRDRSQMLEELRTSVLQMDQDLHRLMREVLQR